MAKAIVLISLACFFALAFSDSLQSERQVPAAWTCPASQYDSGGDCNCNCGDFDPDCLSSETTVGCPNSAYVCNALGGCVPPAWTCSPDFYNDLYACDCDCGAPDPDCELLQLPDDVTPDIWTFCNDPNLPPEPDAGNVFICQNAACVQIAQPPATFTCNWNFYPDHDHCQCECGDTDCANAALPIEGCHEMDGCKPDGSQCIKYIPPAWTGCNVALYRDGDYCDCNCGAPDPDCDNEDLAADPYNCPNDADYYCLNGVCTEAVGVPEEWTCEDIYYNSNDGCDCNCGAPDPDCDREDPGTTYNCFAGETCYTDGKCIATAWTCNVAKYGRDNFCDCECGWTDPDCFNAAGATSNKTVTNCASPNKCVAGKCWNPQSTNPVPGWDCDDAFFNANDGCDCNCGTRDPDCDLPSAQVSVKGCVAGGGASTHKCFISKCVDRDWDCSPWEYNEGQGICHCECGAVDPDCYATDLQAIENCPVANDWVCPFAVCEQDTTPLSWQCNPNYYDTGDGCDCACGAFDPDCNDPELSTYGCLASQVCSAQGTCVAAPVTTGLAAGATTKSLTTGRNVPAGWICNPNDYNTNDGCQCECGVRDPDCDRVGTQVLYNCPNAVNYTCHVASCVSTFGPTVPAEWHCDPNRYGRDNTCDCDCGAPDPDCDSNPMPVFGCPSDEYACSSGFCVPVGWNCAGSEYQNGDGCHCNCGAIDPDCSDANAQVIGCSANQICNEGACEDQSSGVSAVALSFLVALLVALLY